MSAPDFDDFCAGVGQIEREGDITRLALIDAGTDRYSDAQLNGGSWRPPLRMTVRACFSHPAGELKGTAGFGFWNNPLGGALPRLPRAVWFFYSAPPSNMALALDMPGPGWKAATFDAARPLFYALLPLALPGFVLMRIPALYRRLWPLGQRALGVSEALLPVEMTGWHTYMLEWRAAGVDFYVDDAHVHRSPYAPKGPLGFVAWLDNQCAVVTPQGVFGYGRVAMPGARWLALEPVQIEAL
ncbi:MAG: hypothetical protein JXB47_16820 [Anaerolineae bacterium]|nr:hypothetical protein [Anaerolineae bacterium]